MRHFGIRLAISTQSPLSLAPELLELSTVTVLHRFQSPEWYRHLAAKLPLDLYKGGDCFSDICQMNTGNGTPYGGEYCILDNYRTARWYGAAYGGGVCILDNHRTTRRYGTANVIVFLDGQNGQRDGTVRHMAVEIVLMTKPRQRDDTIWDGGGGRILGVRYCGL